MRTKYDRMFNRKSQTVLSEHYSKLIDRTADDPSSLGGDDFITLKRRDHALEETPLPVGYELSKRKLKMGQSKKAMLSSRGNPTKVVFDEDAVGHAIYELAGEEDFRADGDAKEQQRAFVEAEREALRVRDVEDKERAKEKRREKKRKRKDMDGGEVSSSFLPSFFVWGFEGAVADLAWTACRTWARRSRREARTTGTSRLCSTSPQTTTRTSANASTIPTRRRRSAGSRSQRLRRRRSTSRRSLSARWGSGRSREGIWEGRRLANGVGTFFSLPFISLRWRKGPAARLDLTPPANRYARDPARSLFRSRRRRGERAYRPTADIDIVGCICIAG